MFARTQHTKEQKELTTRERKGQDTAESHNQFLLSSMLIPMIPLTWMVRNISNQNTVKDLTEEIDDAGFVRQYNSSHLLMSTCVCLF